MGGFGFDAWVGDPAASVTTTTRVMGTKRSPERTRRGRTVVREALARSTVRGRRRWEAGWRMKTE